MTEEPKARTAKRVKLSPAEKERKNEILKKMQENGEVDRLKSRLYAQLMLQESWREDMKEKTREAVKRSGGPSEITMDELTKALITCGSTRVPSQIESDTKKKIRSVCL